MALRDCSELTQVIYKLARHHARAGAGTVDAVVEAIGDERVDRDILTNALYEASTSQARIMSDGAKRLSKIVREAKLERKVRGDVEKLMGMIERGEVPTTRQLSRPERTPEIQKWMDTRDAARKALANSEPAVAARLEKQIIAYISRLRAGDFATPISETEVPSSERVADLTFQRDKLRTEINKKVREAQPKTIWGQAAESSMAFKGLKASFDLPPLFRQGIFGTFTHPVVTAKAFVKGVEATVRKDSARFYYDEQAKLLDRANAPLYQRDQLALKDIGTTDAFSLDDYAKPGLLEKIPFFGKLIAGGIDRSGRGFTTFLNQLRADLYDTLAASQTKTGTPDAIEGEYIARMVNILTGEGRLGSLERYAPALNVAMFSPRNFAAKLQAAISEPLKAAAAEVGQVTGAEKIRWPGTNAELDLTNLSGTRQLRKAMAKEYAKYIAGNLALYSMIGLAAGNDDDVEVVSDPTSSMAGSVRLGRTYLDPLGGFRPLLVLASRLGSGEKTSAKGKTSPIYGEKVPYSGDTALSLLGTFLRGKLAPAPGLVVSALDNMKDFRGNDVTFLGAAGDLVVPMSPQDMYNAFRDQGLTKGAAESALILTGMGASTFSPPARTIKKGHRP